MKKILLVEDDPFLADIYISKLKESGFETEVVSDGEEAMRLIREKNNQSSIIWPDLLVLDIVLPKLDGWGVLREIRKDSRLKEIKVIILSNLGQKSEVKKGLELGATKYLIKAHFTPSEVIEEIKKVFS